MEGGIAVELNPDDLQAFYRAPEKLSFTLDDARPQYLKPLERPGIAVFFIFPLLKGDEISLGGRIIAVADVYDAVTFSRPYRAGWPVERAIDLIKNGSGGQFDPKVVAAFLELMTEEEGQTDVYCEPSSTLSTS